MNMQSIQTRVAAAALASTSALLLAGCGGGGSSSSSSDGSLTLRVTDAPVDELHEVWVTFSKVIVQPSDEGLSRVEYEIDPPMAIELKALGSGKSVALVYDEPLPAGDYSWVRLVVEPYPETFVYETVADAGIDYRTMLSCPSCGENQSGLKLNRPFSIATDGIVDYTIDFDLRKSITDPVGQDGYKLRPTLRILETEVASTQFSGTVTDEQATAGTPIDPQGCAVYIYEGTGITPDDICILENGNLCPTSGSQPYTEADLEPTGTTGEYSYLSGYVEEGPYTLALACGLDDPETDDNLDFIGTTSVEAMAGENSVDFTISD
jgi:hypothetical protein